MKYCIFHVQITDSSCSCSYLILYLLGGGFSLYVLAQVYMDFIQSIASGATGRNLRNSSAESRHSGAAIKERRQLERAFADSLRECFSDPAIVTLVRRATHLRLKQQNRRSDK